MIALVCLAAAVKHAAHGEIVRTLIDYALGALWLLGADTRAARHLKGNRPMMTTLRCPECATATVVDEDDPDAGFDEAVDHLIARHGYTPEAAALEVGGNR